MSKVILVRMELAHEHADEAELVADSARQWMAVWADTPDAWSVEVVNEDPA